MNTFPWIGCVNELTAWALIGITIIFEVLGTFSMKLSQGLTKPIPSVLIFIFYGICFSTFALVLKKVDLGFAYALWSGIGTLVITIIGVFYFKETMSLVKMASIALIIFGVIGLKLSSGH